MQTLFVPDELACLHQWMLWRYEGGTKVPYQVNGWRGKSNESSSWSSLDECLESKVARDGFAFVFSSADPYCGIDLDDCIVDGVYEPWAQEIIDRFEGLAWCEVSPSGTGVKLTTKAKKPSASMCKQGGVECYDNLRFWTWTGNSIGKSFQSIGDGQAAVEWLIEKYLKANERTTGERRIEPSVSLATASLMLRAQAYADSVPGGRKGGLRNAAFKLSGNLHALVGDCGERLADGDVLSLLHSWNSRNFDKLRDDELAEAAVNGRKNGTPPADKLPEVRLIQNDVDLSEFRIPGIDETEYFEPDASEIELSKVIDPGEFPSDCLLPPGFIADVVKYTLLTSDEPQPILALGGAMCLLSVLTGRKIRNQRDNRTNLFVLGLGPSGCGKDRPRKVNVDILTNIAHPEMIGAVSLGSGHGLESQLRIHPSKLFQLDEIGDLLKAIKKERGSGHMEAILQKIKMLTTSAHQMYTNSATADSKMFFTIDQPHLVIFGTATPEKFWNNLTVDSIEDGFMGRILPLEVTGYGETQEPEIMEIPQTILDQAKAWAEFSTGGNLSLISPNPVVYRMTQDASDRHMKYCRDIDDKIPKDGTHKSTDGLWKRARGRAASLALLFAASRIGPSTSGVIDLDDVELSIKVVNWITRRTIFKVMTQVHENEFQKNCNRILEIIRKQPLDATQLNHRAKWLTSKQRKEILFHLEECGDIESKSVSTKTKSRIVYSVK